MRTKEYWVDQLGLSWALALKDTLKSEYMTKLDTFLSLQRVFGKVYPHEKELFKYFKLCPRETLKVVIIVKEYGVDISAFNFPFDDSYIDSIHNGCIRKISECVHKDYYQSEKKLYFHIDHDFDYLATQGVLVLPLSLTSKVGSLEGHSKQWSKFVGAVLSEIISYSPGTVFMLWGEEAKKYEQVLGPTQHVVTWESPIDAFKENRDWNCPNFKQVDEILTVLNGKKNIIKW
jgi:uracil-DNA glycosylase